MPFPDYRIGPFDQLRHWLPSYALALLWTVAFSLIVMGTGIALCGPIYGSMVAGVASNPHTPLYVRANDALHEKVVGRITLSGLILFGLGVGSLAIHQGLSRRNQAPGSFKRPR